MSKIFPWALNYECGGPEYLDFDVYDEDDSAGLREQLARKLRFRRVKEAAWLTPEKHARNLARRVELQIASDWGLVPAAHNLTMRYQALKSSFLT